MTSGPAIAPAPAVTIRSLCVRRGKAKVLCEVDLTVAPGEMVALVGPNGAGKSTLLAALAGAVRVAGGSIELYGTDITSLTPLEQARRRAVLTQEQIAATPFTCGQIVTMGRYPWARDPEKDRRACDQAMERCGVARFRDRQLSTLSGGERALVAFARILAQEAPVLLLDEPTAALDLRHQGEVMSLARAEAGQGRAVVAVIHDLSLAAGFAHRVVLMDRGRVRASGRIGRDITAELVSDVYGVPIEIAEHRGRTIVLSGSDPPAPSPQPPQSQE